MRRDIEIQKYLPHREPMLMVDKILEISEKSVVTSFEILGGNILLDGDRLSAAGMIENCAQSCSTITGQDLFEDKAEKPKVIGFISNIKKLKIHGFPKVGEILTTKAEFISQFENICNVACSAFSEEKLLMEAEIVMFVSIIDK